MKSRCALLAVFLVFIAVIAPCLAQDVPEFRAMWVSSYGPGLLTPAEIDDTIQAAKTTHLNAIIVQVRKTGDADYKSDYEPRAENLTDPDFDPLAYIIKKAHANGLEVHAWMNTYKIWAGSTPPKSPNHVFNKHPEWINTNIMGQRDKQGTYGVDPGILEAQQHNFNVYMDVVKKYDVDGIHFDYCRYWSPDFGYSKLAVDRFNKETGRTGVPAMDDPVWCQWRRDRVTDLVRQVYEGTKKIKPWVKVTGSVVASHPCPEEFKDSHPYNMLLQDWERWLREGIIDAVMPMNYKSERNPDDAQMFRDWIEGMVRWKYDRHAYNGISVGSADDYAVQVNETRKRGAEGVAGFDFGPRGSRIALAMNLRQNLYTRWVPTPPMPWKPANPHPVMKPADADDQMVADRVVLAFLSNIQGSSIGSRQGGSGDPMAWAMRRLMRSLSGQGFGGGQGRQGFGGGGRPPAQ